MLDQLLSTGIKNNNKSARKKFLKKSSRYYWQKIVLFLPVRTCANFFLAKIFFLKKKRLPTKFDVNLDWSFFFKYWKKLIFPEKIRLKGSKGKKWKLFLFSKAPVSKFVLAIQFIPWGTQKLKKDSSPKISRTKHILRNIYNQNFRIYLEKTADFEIWKFFEQRPSPPIEFKNPWFNISRLYFTKLSRLFISKYIS